VCLWIDDDMQTGRVSATIALCVKLLILWIRSSFLLFGECAAVVKFLWLDSANFILQSHVLFSPRNFARRFEARYGFHNVYKLRKGFRTFMVRFLALQIIDQAGLSLWFFIWVVISWVGFSRLCTIACSVALLLNWTVIMHKVGGPTLKRPDHCHSRRLFRYHG
jgi:hypothetical protein